ncbi:MAG TPA: chemotaxis protein CheW, partial [Verrucomicrobiales bacterium]|nr:chemotaxis protein CheW [Verrucomicrobiales bacterium]
GVLEREQLLKYFRWYGTCGGVRVLAYYILSKHVQLPLEVPCVRSTPRSAEELLAKRGVLSGTARAAATGRQRLDMLRQANDSAGEQEFIDRLCASMWDVSGFMQRLKQRFTQWFNRHKGRKGTLWEERFKSVLVEGAGETLATMAAYIDLNPVRAGIVDDPKDYRWCGYGAAAAGDRLARAGLRVIIAGGERVAEDKLSIPEALAKYRVWLFGQGGEREGFTETGRPLRQGFKRDEVLAVAAAKGQLALEDYLRLKVRYFSDGAVLGTRTFVNEVFAALRERFSSQRQEGARPMAGLKSPLFTLRELRARVFG